MKKILFALLVIAFLLPGCSAPEAPTASNTESAPTNPVYTVSPHLGILTEGNLGSEGLYFPYDGGEMTLDLGLSKGRIEGQDVDGVAIFLFLNGVPQPFRTQDSEEESYVGFFYPERGDPQPFPITFTPVCGSSGETAQLCILHFSFINEVEADGETYRWYLGEYALPCICSIKMQASPPQTEMPCAENVISWEYITEDKNYLTTERKRTDFALLKDGYAVSAKTKYGYKSGQSLKLSTQITFADDADYVLILIADNIPFFFNGEPLSLSGKTGTRAVVSAELHLPELAAGTNVFAVLLRKDYKGIGLGWQYYADSRDVQLLHIVPN